MDDAMNAEVLAKVAKATGDAYREAVERGIEVLIVEGDQIIAIKGSERRVVKQIKPKTRGIRVSRRPGAQNPLSAPGRGGRG
jgi:hypothetical protein